MPESYHTEVTPVADMPGATSIHVGGRVTYREAPKLRESLVKEVAATPSSKVVLELGGVEQMDTSGAAVLVEAWMLGRKRGLKVLLCSPSPSVLRLFRLGGFEEILDFCCPSPGETRRRLLE